MNKLILILILLFSISCKSQTNIIDIVNRCANPSYNETNGSVYLKDISNIYTPYIGTWKWTSGSKEMTMTLLKQTKYHYNSINTNYYEDRLVGYYIYKENGIIIINTSGDNLMQNYGLNVSFDASCYGNVSTSSFEDVKKNKSVSVTLKLLSSTQMKFEGKIDDENYFFPRSGQTATYYAGSTFPLEMIFTKQ